MEALEIIKERLKMLEELVKEYKVSIPLTVVADFLQINAEGLKAALMRYNAPFGFAYQKEDNGYRICVIPTVKFYLWYMNMTGQMVLANEDLAFKSITKDNY